MRRAQPVNNNIRVRIRVELCENYVHTFLENIKKRKEIII